MTTSTITDLHAALLETMARCAETQAAMVALLPQPKLDVTQGYAACKAINDAHKARRIAAVAARNDASMAYEAAKTAFLAAYHGSR